MADGFPSFVRDKVYEQKVQNIVLEALMLGLKDEATNMVMFRTGEIINVMMNIAAMMAADCTLTTSPAKTREFCAEVSRQLQRKIVHTQRLYAAGHRPFETIHLEGEAH